jgi:hypothetical protein
MSSSQNRFALSRDMLQARQNSSTGFGLMPDIVG